MAFPTWIKTGAVSLIALVAAGASFVGPVQNFQSTKAQTRDWQERAIIEQAQGI